MRLARLTALSLVALIAAAVRAQAPPGEAASDSAFGAPASPGGDGLEAYGFEDPEPEDASHSGAYDDYEYEGPSFGERRVRFERDPPAARDVVDEAAWEALTEGYAYERERPEPEVDFEPPSGWEMSEGLLEAVRALAWVLVVALLVGGIAYFAWRGRRSTEVGDAGRSYGLTDELLAASEAELETALERNLREGDYRGAIRYRFGQLLQALRAVGLLRWVPGKTNAEYRDELPAGEIRATFARLAGGFAFATYAGREVGRERYEGFAAEVDRLEGLTTSPPAGRARVAAWPLLVAGLALTACNEWAETYDPDDDGPYGTELLPGVLRAAFPEAAYVPLDDNWADGGLLDGWEGSAAYVAIGDGLSYADTEAESLLAFAAAGGEVLLAAKEVSNAVLAPFSVPRCLTEGELTPGLMLTAPVTVRSARGDELAVPLLTPVIDDPIWARLVARSDSCLSRGRDLLALRRRGGNSAATAGWSDTTRVDPLLTRLPYGAGAVTLLSFPLALTNVYATDSAGRALVEEIVSYLPAGAEIVFFDEPRRSPEWVVIQENRPPSDFAFGSPSSADDNVLKHVLSRPPLAAAWYALLAGGVAFLALGVKRRQRVVPLVHPRRNTTHEHLGNVSRLYLAAPDNGRMGRKQLTLFESWARGRFGLSPLRDPDDMRRFRALRGVDGDLVDALERYHTTLERGQGVSNGGLVRLVRILQAVRRGVR